MASHYSANQYDDAFRARRLQQYTVPKQFKNHPSSRTGNTKIVGDDIGHLLPGVPRSMESPWGNFQGTWDMPNRIPGNHLSNTCARKCDQPVHDSYRQPFCYSPPGCAGGAEACKQACKTDAEACQQACKPDAEACQQACKTDSGACRQACKPDAGACKKASETECKQQGVCKAGSAKCFTKDCGDTSGRKACCPLSPCSPEPRNRDPRLPTPLERETAAGADACE